MIFTERTVTVTNDNATINRPLILYRGDKNIELKITIAESQFKFRNTDASNVIDTTDASYAQLVINTPYGSPIFSDVAATKNGAVIFVITEGMIDEIRELGSYSIQIRLLDDNKQSRATIPPVSNAIEIKAPIAIEDGSAIDGNTVNTAMAGYAVTTYSTPLESFDSQGNYIKTTWGEGDVITDAKLNKIEAGIDGVNKKVASVGTSGQGMTQEQISQLSTAYQHSQSAHAPSNAEANVQADWNITDTTSDAYIKNKPTNLVTTDQLPTVPTNVSAFTNDAGYTTETFVTNKIAEAQLGGGSGTVDLSGYVTKEIGNANQITFADGQTFQSKLDAGTLKGDKGDTGEQGPQGAQGIQGPAGTNGQDGLTTAISVNGTTYAHSNGVITLPDYPSTSPTDEQVNTAVNNYLTNNPITIDDMWSDFVEGEIYNVSTGSTPTVTQTGIQATFTQGSNIVYADSTLDSLKSMLVVNKIYSDGTSTATTDYTLSGTLTVGTSTVTVTSGTYTTTFNVTVSEKPIATLSSISAAYSQSGTVTTSTNLNDLKPDLVVTATYSDGSTANITNYSLSGTLTVGTSTITVTYEDKTTTFNVTVSETGATGGDYVTNNLLGYYDLTGYADDNYGELHGESSNLYSVALTDKSGVNKLNAYAFTKNTQSAIDKALLGFENGEYRSGKVNYYGGEGQVTRIGIQGITYPFSVEMYGKFCGGMNSPTTDSKDTYEFPLELFTSRVSIDNIASSGSMGSVVTLNDATTLAIAGSVGQGADTITLSNSIDIASYHHFVLCYDQNLFNLYVDGTLIGTSSVKQNASVSIVCPMTNGVSKMVRIYNSILTNQEVTQNKNEVLATYGGVS